MYFWLKFFHIAAMAIWFTALFFLPRLFIASVHADRPGGRGEDEKPRLNAIGKTLYFGVMTPAAVITVVLGIVLIAYGFQGPWLPAKLALVALAVMLHLYFGQLLVDLSHGHTRHTSAFYRVLNWLPLPLFLGIVALAAAKPGALPPLGGV
ncbi:CopD family protein [Alkalisalibacterium limincola]|nr:CopD family protein [Alkalisalibacterium limincola]